MMEISTMGKVLVPAKIENLNDLFLVEQGNLAPDQVRRIEVIDALVDTGTMPLMLPRRVVEQLGLQRYRTRRAKTSGGMTDIPICGMVLLTVQGRECRLEIGEIPDECPVLIGQVPLELLDFIVDPIHQRLIGNPDHGGEHMIEWY
ncbi:MAG: clan AA aspartic protease [Gemmataceae bacterium]